MRKPIAFHAAYNWNDQSLALTNRFISVHASASCGSTMVHMTNWVVKRIAPAFPQAQGDVDRERLTWA